MLIKVKVFSEARETSVVKKNRDSYEVYVKAKPIKGQANREVVEVLTTYLKIPVEKIRLVRGFKRHSKIFEVK